MDILITSLLSILVFSKTLVSGMTPLSCEGVVCPEPKRCVMQQVQCITPPCNPVPMCASVVSKPGRCPLIRDAGVCMQQCALDSQCGSSLKCCYNGCGNICVLPEDDISVPRECPHYKTIDSRFCNMHHKCDGDQQCGHNQKCCKRGCQRKCIDIVHLPPVIREQPAGGIGRCSASQIYLYCRSGSFNPKCCTQCGLRCSDPTLTTTGHCPNVAPAYNYNAPECIHDNKCPSGKKCCPCRVSYRSWGHGSGFKNQCVDTSGWFAGSYRRKPMHKGHDHGSNGNGDGGGNGYVYGSGGSSSGSSSEGHGYKGGDHDTGYVEHDDGGGGSSSSSSSSYDDSSSDSDDK